MVPINSLLLTVTLYSWVITTLVYNETKRTVRFLDLITEFDWMHLYYIGVYNMLLAFCIFILAFMSKIKVCNSEERSLRYVKKYLYEKQCFHRI